MLWFHIWINHNGLFFCLKKFLFFCAPIPHSFLQTLWRKLPHSIKSLEQNSLACGSSASNFSRFCSEVFSFFYSLGSVFEVSEEIVVTGRKIETVGLVIGGLSSESLSCFHCAGILGIAVVKKNISDLIT